MAFSEVMESFTTFRAQSSAAPLKPPWLANNPVETMDIPRSIERGPVEASGNLGMGGSGSASIPRSIERGPVEASVSAPRRQNTNRIPRSIERGPVEAA